MMQLALDLSEPLPEWTGSPLHFHTDYLDPEDHLEAFERWVEENGVFGCLARSGMWHRALCSDPFATANGHSHYQLIADLRSDDRPDVQHVEGIERFDRLLYQSICRECRWHTIHDGENKAVEAWHDHAFPGWRTLPVVPLSALGSNPANHQTRAGKWALEHYPKAWRIGGAPIRTERERGATRHVAGRSPFGGFDLGTAPLQTTLEGA